MGIGSRANQSFSHPDTSLFNKSNGTQLNIESPKTEHSGLQVRNMRSQLSFMISENDTLRLEVKSLSRSLKSTQSAINDLSTSHSSNAFVEGLSYELQQLRLELRSAREERDTANKEVLLLKQVSMYFKHKDETEERAIANQLFMLE